MEYLTIEQRVAQLASQDLDVTVLPRAARRVVDGSGSQRIQTFSDLFGGEFRTIV